MKKLKIFFTILSATLFLPVVNSYAQDTTATSPFTAGVDIVSSYVWRGSALSGPSFQPSVKFSKGGFTAGVWGSFDFTGTYGEADPYISYSAPFGLSLTLTDYYLTSTSLFNSSDTAGVHGSHGIEISLGYTLKGFSISTNYIFNEAPHLGTSGGDIYLQLGYGFNNFNFFVGAGNGWHTLNDDNGDDKFNICNIGISATKELKVTDSFSIPVFGQIVVNPDTEKLFVIVGLTF